MKIFCLLGVGRSGIDFLQTLFDRHPQISQFPGVFSFDFFLEKIKKIDEKKKIAEIFIKEYERFFDSKIYKIERHDELGTNQNESFKVSKENFIKQFIKICGNIKKKNDIFTSLHLAYSSASGENIELKKIIVWNVHNFENLNSQKKNLDFQILISLRNPISSINSSISHWLAYSKKNVNLWWLNYQINRLSNLIKDCLSLNKKSYVLRLDLLHTKNLECMYKICKIMNIDYHDNMKLSTYHGKLWRGDRLSKRNLGGVNKNFQDKYSNNNFFKKDIIYLENSLSFYYEKYRYQRFSKNCEIKFYQKLLPLKIELIVWKNLVINLNFKQIIMIPYYYIKRILMLKSKKNKDYYPELI